MTSEVELLPRAKERPIARTVRLVHGGQVLALPADDTNDRWNLRTATAAWLASRKSDHTRAAYAKDLANYLAWCERTGLDPRDARRGDVDAWVQTLVNTKTGAPLASSSLARKLSSVASWYDYLVSNEVSPRNPVTAVDRPNVDRDSSPTIGLAGAEMTAFMRAARAATGRTAKRDAALLALLTGLGLRVAEALRLDLDSLRWNIGHRTVRVVGKGGKVRELPIPAPIGRDVDAWLAVRGDESGPLFRTLTGARLDQPYVFRLVQRTAKAAGLPNAEKLSPHSLRHSLATAALDQGAALRDVQDLMGHQDPRTTRRYDRKRGNLDRSPAYTVAKLFAQED